MKKSNISVVKQESTVNIHSNQMLVTIPLKHLKPGVICFELSVKIMELKYVFYFDFFEKGSCFTVQCNSNLFELPNVEFEKKYKFIH